MLLDKIIVTMLLTFFLHIYQSNNLDLFLECALPGIAVTWIDNRYCGKTQSFLQVYGFQEIGFFPHYMLLDYRTDITFKVPMKLQMVIVLLLQKNLMPCWFLTNNVAIKKFIVTILNKRISCKFKWNSNTSISINY